MIKYILGIDGDSFSFGGNLARLKPADFDFPSEKNRRLSISGAYSDYYRPGGLESSNSSFGRWIDLNAVVSGKNRICWEINFSIINHYWKITSFKQDINQYGRFKSNRSPSHFNGKIAFGPEIIDIGFSLERHVPFEFHISNALDFKEYGAVGIGWRRKHFRPELDVHWQDDSASVDCFIYNEGFFSWTRLPRIYIFDIELNFQRYNYFQDNDDASQPILTPWGRQYGYHGIFSFSLDRWKIYGGAREQDFDLMAYGYKDPYDYAKVTAFDLNIKSLFSGIEVNSRGLEKSAFFEFELMNWDGFSRGHLEFWPFTSGFIDLLGLRRYYISETEGSLRRFHFGGWKKFNGRWIGSGGINMIYIKPEAELSHWRPAFLIFGKADEKHHRLDITKNFSGVLHLSAIYKRRAWDICYSFSQIIPFKTWRREKEFVDQPGRKAAAVYGGGFHQFKINYHL
ncbi:MAG: hypothetical protein JSW64_01420 [Candidatus Zixiibacteriota bacterium]|nr:MAG: hypothetical protein JSW64_01420 [candidate division Zixibacteria bacterium]